MTRCVRVATSVRLFLVVLDDVLACRDQRHELDGDCDLLLDAARPKRVAGGSV